MKKSGRKGRKWHSSEDKGAEGGGLGRNMYLAWKSREGEEKVLFQRLSWPV